MELSNVMPDEPAGLEPAAAPDPAAPRGAALTKSERSGQAKRQARRAEEREGAPDLGDLRADVVETQRRLDAARWAAATARGDLGMAHAAVAWPRSRPRTTPRPVRAEARLACGAQDAGRDAIRAARGAILDTAAKISDAALRASFLERVPEHAQTLALAGRLERRA